MSGGQTNADNSTGDSTQERMRQKINAAAPHLKHDRRGFNSFAFTLTSIRGKHAGIPQSIYVNVNFFN